MNKQDLIDAVAQNSGLTKTVASTAVDALLASITDALKKGEDVRLLGFGSFSVTERAATEGRNPRTGEKIQIPASKQPKFSAGQTLKSAVNS